MCMMLGLELRTWCITSCMLYHYATMVKSSVISMDSTLYLVPGQDIHYTRYPLAGVGRLARAQRLTPLWPWRHWSGHQLGSPFWLHSTAWMKQWTAARLRNRSLGLTGIPAGPRPAHWPWRWPRVRPQSPRPGSGKALLVHLYPGQ
jgi:hypothetical protein